MVGEYTHPTMQRMIGAFMRWMGVLLLGLLAGCAAGRQTSGLSTETELILNGDDTRQRLAIHPEETITPDEADEVLADEEMCYLTLDKVTIECFPFGSLLMMGPDDAVELVADNPLDDLHADNHDPHGELMLRTLAVVGVIADSVERLPGVLADYLDNTESLNPGVAATLAHRLIDSSQVDIAGMSRAGPFTIKLELTEDGKEVLREALADRETNGFRYVHHLHRSTPRHGTLKVSTSSGDDGPLLRGSR
jgi:hypothetical protein